MAKQVPLMGLCPIGKFVFSNEDAIRYKKRLQEKLTAAFPGVAYVDGAHGIARRIAYLTREQPWPAERPPGIALFTSAAREPLLGSLAAYGLDEVESL